MPAKKWPGYRRTKPQLTPGNRARYFSREKLKTDKLFGTKQVQRWANQANTMRHAQPAGRQDPLSIMLVIDLLMRLEPETEVRARDLAEILNEEYKDIWWDAITTGRIMTNLMTIVEQYCTAPVGQRVLECEKDRDGFYYLLIPSVPNWIFLGEMRERIGVLAREVIQEEEATHIQHIRPDFPWEIFEGLSYRTGGATPA